MDINDLNDENNNFQQIVVSDEAIMYLQTTQKWTRFLAVLGFIGTGFMVVFGLMFSLLFNTIGSFQEGLGTMPFGSSFGLLYVAIAALYFFPSLYLYKFSNFSRAAILTNNSDDLTNAFKYLKIFNKFIGIITIAFLALYPILLVILGGFYLVNN